MSGDSCFDWQRGLCERGSKCRFRHAGAAGQGGPEIGRRGPRRSKECYAWSQRGSCEHGATCVFEHGDFSGPPSASPPTVASRGVCFDFRAGRCTRGDSCRHKHLAGTELDRVKSMDCFAWKRGECTRGTMCRYLHNEADGPPPSPSPSPSLADAGAAAETATSSNSM